MKTLTEYLWFSTDKRKEIVHITPQVRDAVLRYNAEGLAGLHDRPRPGSKPRLDEAHRSALRQLILDGPEVETTGLSA